MPYIVNEQCIRCVYLDCVQVCPVDCFRIGANMVVIHPDECIDCGVCEPECPVNAILSDVDPAAHKWLEHNRVYAEQWPGLTTPVDATAYTPDDADTWKDVPDKLKRFFDARPGEPN